MSNHRVKCFYCKESVLSRSIGHHIIRKHVDTLFSDKNNREALHKEKYLKEPIPLFIDVNPFLFCLADNSSIKRQDIALQHFMGKTDQHREAVLALREKYPLDGSAPVGETVVRREYLTEAETKLLQDFMAQVVAHDSIGFTRKERALFTKLGVQTDTETVKQMYPQLFDQEEEEEEEQHEEPNEEPPPPLEPQEEEEEQQTIEVLDKKIETYTPPPPHLTPTLPKPRQDIFLPQPSRQPSYPTVKIIQSTKRS